MRMQIREIAGRSAEQQRINNVLLLIYMYIEIDLRAYARINSS